MLSPHLLVMSLCCVCFLGGLVRGTKGLQSLAKATRSNSYAKMTSSSEGSTTAPRFTYLMDALLLQGQVMKGYGRGSKKLGVPTANLPHFDEQLRRGQYQRGVYFGWGAVAHSNVILPCVANIGVSPTFAGQENAVNIVEAHLLDKVANEGGDGDENGDFYGRDLRLCLVGFLRPERKFSSLPELVTQINSDIQLTRTLCAGSPDGPRSIAEQFLTQGSDNKNGGTTIGWALPSVVCGRSLVANLNTGETLGMWHEIPLPLPVS